MEWSQWRILSHRPDLPPLRGPSSGLDSSDCADLPEPKRGRPGRMDRLWYPSTYNGPACYELGLRRNQEEEPIVVYVGETGNESQRIHDYGYDGERLGREISEALKRGDTIVYRSSRTATKEEAGRMEKLLLSRGSYPWNTIGQGWRASRRRPPRGRPRSREP